MKFLKSQVSLTHIGFLRVFFNLFSAPRTICNTGLVWSTIDDFGRAEVCQAVGLRFLHCFSTVPWPMEFPKCQESDCRPSACCCTISPECGWISRADGGGYLHAVEQGGGQPLRGGVTVGEGTSLSWHRGLKPTLIARTGQFSPFQLSKVLSPIYKNI